MDPLMILDIKEKETTTTQAPSFPQIKSTTTGYPEPKKRSRFASLKQKQQGAEPPQNQPPQKPAGAPGPDASKRGAGPVGQSSKAAEKRSIDRENQEIMAGMSPEEIEAARKELFNGLDPSVLEMLLKRATLDPEPDGGPIVFPEDEPTAPPVPPPVEDKARKAPGKKVTFEDESTSAPEALPGQTPPSSEQTPSPSIPSSSAPAPTDKMTPPVTIPSTRPAEDDDTTAAAAAAVASHTHWPAQSEQSDLDPADPNFLESLHKKYFPSLPADPSKLAWMAPVPTPHSPADRESPYYPGQPSLSVTALRFDFRGTLLPPRISRAIPVSKGLHHHGEAPEAAGYTINELGRLARSAVPGQRCLAYQTLGRVLFRLGRGEFGDVADGVWAAVQEGRIMESIYEEAGMDPDAVAQGNIVGDGKGRGHRSAYAFAVEAVWLFERGGWRERLRRGK